MIALSLLTLLSAAPDARADEVHRMIPGEKKVLPMPASGEQPDVRCAAEVAQLYLSFDGRGLEVEARAPGTCEVTLGGALHTFKIYDPADASGRTCDEARERARGTGLSVRCRGGYTIVEGYPLDPLVRYELENWAASRAGVVINFEAEAREEVEVTVSFLELRRLDSLDVGIGWPEALPELLVDGLDRLERGQAISPSMAGPLAENVSAESVLSSFEVLEIRSGRTVMGEPIEIREGGIIYRELTGVQAVELAEIPFGFQSLISVTPHGLGYELDIDLSVSEEVPGSSRHGFTLSERATSTTVNLDLGDTVVIATGSSNRSWDWRSGLPLLSRIPVLGALFGTHRRSNSPVMGAVMVTVSEPGEHPEWLARLQDLQRRLGASW